jgi:hypothetical protein
MSRSNFGSNIAIALIQVSNPILGGMGNCFKLFSKPSHQPEGKKWSKQCQEGDGQLKGVTLVIG